MSPTALAAALGRVHRHVGVSEQIVRRLVSRRRGDADAGTDLHLIPAQREGVRHRGGSRSSKSGASVARRHVLDEDGELVATESGDGVGGASAGEEPLGRGDQQPVAFGVTETVVDPLEVVEVEEEHRDRPAPRAVREPAHGSRGRGRARDSRDR